MSIRDPKMARTAGKSVTETETAMTTATSPAIAIERTSLMGVMRSAASAQATPPPASRMAVPALFMAVAAAMCASARASSSRKRLTISSE